MNSLKGSSLKHPKPNITWNSDIYVHIYTRLWISMVTRQASSLKRKNSTSIGLLSDLNKHRQVGNPHYWFLLIKVFWNLAFSFKQIQFGTTDFNINGTSLSCFCTNTAVLPQNATAKSPICNFKGEKNRSWKIISHTDNREAQKKNQS